MVDGKQIHIGYFDNEVDAGVVAEFERGNKMPGAL
jgi:hypothetical protein